ncbi:MAG: TIGR03085 family metal-binding protein [Acidimicrobiales bacterium]
MPSSHLARTERARLCDVLTESGEVAPTLCEGWLTRDLVAHLFVRERRPVAMPGILLGGPLGQLTNRSMASALHRFGYAGLVAKVRSGPPLLWRPFDEFVNLVEFFVHTEDVRRASPNFEPRSDAQLDAALWSALGRMSRLLAHRVRGAGLDLERPDGARIVARRAQPRAVLGGGAQELVLFLYGRKQVARVTLSGAGQQAVREARFGL